MVDISNVSQNVLNKLKTIEMHDGKKGISAEERNALAQLLASGEISGSNNKEYIQSLIDNYDLKEAEMNASKDVKDAIKKAVNLDGDKNTLTEREAAVLDQIIDNTTGKYSKEDIELAKMTKKSMGLTDETPLANAKKENAKLEGENAKLKTQNEKLNNAIGEYQEDINELLKQIEELESQLEAKEKELAATDTATKSEIAQLKAEIKSLKRAMLEKPNQKKTEHRKDAALGKDTDQSNLPNFTERTESIFKRGAKLVGVSFSELVATGAMTSKDIKKTLKKTLRLTQ